MGDTDIRMSYYKFCSNITAIKRLSDELTDGWELVNRTGNDSGSYLKKRALYFNKHNTAPEQETNGNVLSDSAFEYIRANVIFCEYHVTYNLSYGAPMLCFNMWNSDGRCLTMEEAWGIFNKNYSQENMLSVLTQNDHPVLLEPFLVLHPCKTVEMIEHLLSKSNNPVLSWLSAVGPAVNLKIRDEYEKLTRPTQTPDDDDDTPFLGFPPAK